MPKFDLTITLKDFRGEDIKIGAKEGEDGKPMTLGDAILLALKLPAKDDDRRGIDSFITGHAVNDLVSKARTDGAELELDASQITFVCERAAKALWMEPVLVGRIIEAIDPARLKKSST